MIKNKQKKTLLSLMGISLSLLLVSCSGTTLTPDSDSTSSETNKPSVDTGNNETSSPDSSIPLEPIIPIEPSEPEVDDKEEVDLSIDPFYPTGFLDTPYTLEVPSLKNRLTLNEDKSLVTLFAPGVSKEGGYYDVNKNFRNDNHLCWGATDSNLIAWYLDRVEEQGIDTSSYTRDVNEIFNNFRANWNYLEGFDPMQGLAWYFTGKTLTQNAPDELLNPNSGGYLKSLPNVGDTWSILDPANHYPIVGNYSEQYPFMDDNIRLDPTYLDFSKNVIGQLHYGPSGLMIVKKGASNLGSHAITLWGCDYEPKTGLIKAVYVTDSDDELKYPGKYLNRVKIKEENNNGYHGARMVDYYLPNGDPAPFSYISAATNLFSPTVVKKK